MCLNVMQKKKIISNNPKGLQQKHQSNIIIGHLNTNNLNSKLYKAVKLLLNYFDIFTFAETKLDDSLPNSQFKIQSFNVHTQDRNCYGGGLLVYVRSDIPHMQRQEHEENCNGIENLIIEIIIRGEKWLYVSIYRPQSINVSALMDKLEKILR